VTAAVRENSRFVHIQLVRRRNVRVRINDHVLFRPL
jgi:hypothetical protein